MPNGYLTVLEKHWITFSNHFQFLFKFLLNGEYEEIRSKIMIRKEPFEQCWTVKQRGSIFQDEAWMPTIMAHIKC